MLPDRKTDAPAPMSFPIPGRPGRAARGWLLYCCFALLALLAGAAVHAQQDTVADADAKLTKARERIDDIRKRLDDGKAGDADLVQWRADALQMQADADGLAESLAPRLADVTTRLNQLGPVPPDVKEAADVAEQRRQLERDKGSVDAQLKLAKLLSVDAAQMAERISAQRRTLFQAELGERRGTFLSPAFWAELRTELPRDLRRFGELADELQSGMRQTPPSVWMALAAALAVVLAARRAIGRLLLRVTSTRVPPGRLRRSFLAAALVLLGVATPGVIAELTNVGLAWSGTLPQGTEALLSDMVGMVCLAGYVAGLGYALISASRPSWRLLSMPDEVAQGLRWLPITLAVLATAVWLARRLPAQLNISLTTTIALNSLAAAALGVAMAGALLHGERLRRRAKYIAEEDRVPSRPFWIATVANAAWVALSAGVLALLVGYAAFGTFVITQGLWVLVVAASAYLISLLLEDGVTTVVAGRHREDKPQQPLLREQAAVLLSGLGRIAVLLAAAVLLMSPFGEGPAELLHRLDQLRRGLQVGELELRPAALLQALLALAAGLLCVRVLKRWLKDRYLPTTGFDPGMQVSAATLFGYAGVVFAVALSLSALGLGLERVAWIASALSVGIGFGLQAVVQNFVSGLILLAERPVKVGDWVSLGGIEGDIQRINVRATEIQMPDRSTVIVPNSEFITKTVRNVTHANPLGRVQIRLPMPLSTDSARVRELILQAFAEQPDILEAPSADVFLDGIEGDRLMFNAVGYVSSPRAAYGVRSRLLFDVLQRLAQARLDMSPAATMVLRDAQDPAPPQPATAPSAAVAPPAGDAPAAARRDDDTGR